MRASSLLKSWSGPRERLPHLLPPGLAASVREDDDTGSLSARTVSALRQSGLLAMALPRRYGGPELPPLDAVLEVEALAAVNAPAAWHAAVSSTGSMTAWVLSETAVRRIWNDGSATLVGGSGQAGGQAEAVPGGIRILSGRWRWGSGVNDANWMQVGITLTNGETVTAFLPRDGGFLSENDWNALGLRASSSASFHAISGQFVPDALVLRKTGSVAHSPVADGVLGRFSVVSYNSALFAAAAIGNAIGALDEFADIAEKKTAVTASASLAQSSDTWRHYGDALVSVTGARALLHDAVRNLAADAEARASPDPARQALARASFAAAADQSTRAIQLCFELAGSSAVERSCPLERRLRDALVINQHYYLSKRAPALLGKACFDNELTEFENDYLRR